jgi:hypothetical protein
MSVTVRQLVENARARHPAFTKLAWPEGALLLFLNTYQRTKLLELADSIEPLVGQARQIASVIAGALVGSDAGVPYYITTSGDGWPVQSDAGVPYVDFTQPAVALDPFGQSGGTPGFPLPAEFIRLINITAASLYDAQMQVEIIPESRRAAAPQRALLAFISGNRIVPVRVGVSPYSDRWIDVTSVTMSYVAMQTLAALADVLTLPLQLVGLLEAALAERFAVASEISDRLRQTFIDERKQAEAAFAESAAMILDEVTTSHVQFNG